MKVIEKQISEKIKKREKLQKFMDVFDNSKCDINYYQKMVKDLVSTSPPNDIIKKYSPWYDVYNKEKEKFFHYLNLPKDEDHLTRKTIIEEKLENLRVQLSNYSYDKEIIRENGGNEEKYKRIKKKLSKDILLFEKEYSDVSILDSFIGRISKINIVVEQYREEFEKLNRLRSELAFVNERIIELGKTVKINPDCDVCKQNPSYLKRNELIGKSSHTEKKIKIQEKKVRKLYEENIVHHFEKVSILPPYDNEKESVSYIHTVIRELEEKARRYHHMKTEYKRICSILKNFQKMEESKKIEKEILILKKEQQAVEDAIQDQIFFYQHKHIYEFIEYQYNFLTIFPSKEKYVEIIDSLDKEEEDDTEEDKEYKEDNLLKKIDRKKSLLENEIRSLQQKKENIKILSEIKLLEKENDRAAEYKEWLEEYEKEKIYYERST